MKKWLLKSPSQMDIIRLFQAWRLWLIGALVGALLAGAAYAIFPPPYRAQATVVVDHNLEQAWPVNTDRELFYYLERETQKLEAVAWSDAVMQTVAAPVESISVADLRHGKLLLSHPSDGGWHFWADDADPEQAARLASAWAQAFVEKARQGVETAIQLDAAHVALLAASSQGSDTTALEAKVTTLESQSLGLSPYIQVSLSQSEQLPVARSASLGAYLFAGAAAAAVIAALLVLLVDRNESNETQSAQ